MITKQRQLFYFVGQKPFASLKEAQLEDLKTIFAKAPHLVTPDMMETPEQFKTRQTEKISEFVLENAAPIVDILTTTPRSRVKARKTNGGGPKTKKPKLQPASLEAK